MFDDSTSCWDANADHTYRLFMRAGESVHIKIDTSWDCLNEYSSWSTTLKVFTNSGCADTACTTKTVCMDQDDIQETTYVAAYTGWHIIVVDGSSAFDDEGDYTLEVDLTCNVANCGC